MTEEQFRIAKETFDEEVGKKLSTIKKVDEASFFTENKYNKIVDEIDFYETFQDNKTDIWKRGRDLSKKYKVLEINGLKSLAMVNVKKEKKFKIEMCTKVGLISEGFTNIYDIHDSNQHPGQRTTWDLVKQKYGQSYPLWMVKLLKKVCPICLRHQQHKEVKAGYTPIQTNGFLTRVQIDLIDMTSFEDGDYKYILSVKDLGNEICRPKWIKVKDTTSCCWSSCTIIYHYRSSSFHPYG